MVEQRHDRDTLEFEIDPAGLDLRQIEQVMDHGLHAMHLVMGRLKQFLFFFRQIVHRMFQQQINPHSQTGERGPQFVRCGHHKLAFQPFKFSQLRDILEQQYDSGQFLILPTNPRG